MGVSHEKNWEKRTPPSLSHEGRWGERFFNITVNQIGHLEKELKKKVSEVRNCNGN